MTKKERDECKNKISKLTDEEIEDNLIKLDNRIKDLTFKKDVCIAEKNNRNVKKRYGG